MIIPIKESKQQLEILLQNLKIPDPNEVDIAKRVDGLFTVSTIDIPTNGVEKNQNLKVYSNFNSGFGGQFYYTSQIQKRITKLYFHVTQLAPLILYITKIL